LVQNTKTGKNIPNYHKLCQMSIKCNKRLLNGQSVHKICQHIPLQDPPKFTQIWIFGLKTNHLATLGLCKERVCLALRALNGLKCRRIHLPWMLVHVHQLWWLVLPMYVHMYIESILCTKVHIFCFWPIRKVTDRKDHCKF
jgi:hypothetical protein